MLGAEVKLANEKTTETETAIFLLRPLQPLLASSYIFEGHTRFFSVFSQPSDMILWQKISTGGLEGYLGSLKGQPESLQKSNIRRNSKSPFKTPA